MKKNLSEIFFLLENKAMLREKDFMLYRLGPENKSFRGIGMFLGVYFGASLFAAIMTPVIFGFVVFMHNACKTEFWYNQMDYGADVFYDRLRYIPIVLGLPWMLKKTGLLSFSYIGLGLSKINLKVFLKYLAFGALIALVIFGSQFMASEKSKFMWPQLASAGDFFGLLGTLFFKCVLAALLVSLLEEVLFRGLIFRCVYTASGLSAAMVFTSAFFAYKHFKVPASVVANNLSTGKHEVAWNTGFEIFWYDSIGVLLSWNAVLFFSLAMFGAVLVMVYVRSKILWAPIGFHAGVVLVMFLHRNFVKVSPTKDQAAFFGGANPSNGFLAILILAPVVLLFYCLYWRKQKLLVQPEL